MSVHLTVCRICHLLVGSAELDDGEDRRLIIDLGDCGACTQKVSTVRPYWFALPKLKEGDDCFVRIVYAVDYTPPVRKEVDQKKYLSWLRDKDRTRR